jgi:hypothetical protein
VTGRAGASQEPGPGSGDSDATGSADQDRAAPRLIIDSLRRHDPEIARTAESVLQPGEGVRVAAHAAEAVVLVTDRRLFVIANARIALDIPFHGIRRVELDLERDRAATLVIVPDHPRSEPQVLSIPTPEIANASAAVAAIGEVLARDAGRSPGQPD